MDYCKDIFKYIKNKTKVVNIGNVPLGGNVPIRLQSMTNTDTNNIDASVEQCLKIINEGADYVRLTTQGKREIESLIKIKDILRSKEIYTPIIADIHFNPKIAELAAQYFEKVRINPGNYVDKKINKVEYSDEEYNLSIEKIKQNIKPLIQICKKNNTAIRIGINHGSLSERIMSKYGDTPEGMVESAMEFIKIFKEENFENIVISMKSSNVRVMVQSNRLLGHRMKKEELKTQKTLNKVMWLLSDSYLT